MLKYSNWKSVICTYTLNKTSTFQPFFNLQITKSVLTAKFMVCIYFIDLFMAIVECRLFPIFRKAREQINPKQENRPCVIVVYKGPKSDVICMLKQSGLTVPEPLCNQWAEGLICLSGQYGFRHIVQGRGNVESYRHRGDCVLFPWSQSQQPIDELPSSRSIFGRFHPAAPSPLVIAHCWQYILLYISGRVPFHLYHVFELQIPNLKLSNLLLV